MIAFLRRMFHRHRWHPVDMKTAELMGQWVIVAELHCEACGNTKWVGRPNPDLQVGFASKEAAMAWLHKQCREVQK